MKEKYTITITENGTNVNIEHGSTFSILAWISALMKDIVELTPTSVCKDKDDRKNLVMACCKAVMDQIDEEEEEVPHVHQNQLS